MIKDIAQNFTIIIKLSNACNLACSYCYNRNDNISSFLKTMDMERIFIQLREFGNLSGLESLQISYHGGEPLLLGHEYLEKIFKLKEKIFKKIKFSVFHTIQTNMTMLNKEYLRLFLNYGVEVGISTDIINNARVFNTGRAVDSIIDEKINLLKEFSIPISILCVINQHNIFKPREVYNYLKEHNASAQFIPSFDVHSNAKDDPYGINSAKLYEFMKTIFDLWINDSKRVGITNLAHFSILAQRKPGFLCVNSKNCANCMLSIEPDGTVFHCPFYYDTKRDYSYGNILRENIWNIYDNRVYDPIFNRRRHIDKICINCKFLNVCNGGCKAEAQYGGNSLGKSYFCIFYKKMTKYIQRNSYTQKR